MWTVSGSFWIFYTVSPLLWLWIASTFMQSPLSFISSPEHISFVLLKFISFGWCKCLCIVIIFFFLNFFCLNTRVYFRNRSQSVVFYSKPSILWLVLVGAFFSSLCWLSLFDRRKKQSRGKKHNSHDPQSLCERVNLSQNRKKKQNDCMNSTNCSLFAEVQRIWGEKERKNIHYNTVFANRGVSITKEPFCSTPIILQ